MKRTVTIILTIALACVFVMGQVPSLYSKSQSNQSNSFNSIPVKIVKVDRPNFNGSTNGDVKAKKVVLKQKRIKSNKITDVDVWLKKYSKGIPYVSSTFTFGEDQADDYMRAAVPVVFNGLYRRDIDIYSDYSVIYYGKQIETGFEFGYDPLTVVITDASLKKPLYAFDFSNFSVKEFSLPSDVDFTAMSVSNVTIEGNTLYAMVSHSTYAYSSQGMNAYLVAIDLTTNKTKWVSEPLTCNSSFVIYDDVIFTGYGFTKEGAHLYVVDKASGNRISTIKLKKAPEIFSIIGKTLYVRTYSYDYEFSIVR